MPKDNLDDEDYEETPKLQKLVELKALRASTKGSISRIKALITKKGSSLSTEELECRLGILESYFKQVLSVQANIDKIAPGAEAEGNAEYLGDVEDAYVCTKATIMSLLPSRRESVSNVSMGNAATAMAGPSRLRRQIDVPKFNGKYSEFSKFSSIFTKMVHNNESYDDYERLIILRESLCPKPLSTISEFDVTDANYPKALERLKEVYDKKALMFEEHVGALFDLPMAMKTSAANLRNIVDSVNAHLSAMLSLGSYADITSAILIHLVMKKIDSDSRTKWEESVDYTSLSKWKDCSDILSRRCQNLEAREAKADSAVERQVVTTLKRSQRTTLALAVDSPTNSEPFNAGAVATLDPSTSKQTTLHTTFDDIEEIPEVFLETAVILVKGCNGRYYPARAILDSASQINLMCEQMARRLMLRKIPCVMGASGIGDISTNLRKKTQTTIKSRVNDFEVSLEFYVLPTITGVKPDRFMDVSKWNVPQNIDLADPEFNVPGRVDILLGAEIFLDLLSIGRILLREGLPRLQKTLLGWVVSGATRECSTDCSKAQTLLLETEQQGETMHLQNLVEKFWQMEQIPLKSTFWTEEERACERIFAESVSRDESGKFVVKLPLKSTVTELGDSYRTAERRFLALERRLDRDLVTKKAYENFINEYLTLGHMSEVAPADIVKLKYFSPHQYVVRPDSSTTKLRVVFDCSCKSSSGLSLNDVMMKGPIVQDDLLSIVLRFRCYKYALTADVTKMYRQAWVTREDTDFQAILWRASRNDKLKAYRLLTVTYGTTAAPFLATRCLKQLSIDSAETHPLGSRKILKDFYMDDLITGADNEAELFQLYEELSTVMNAAHFNLRKWHSNNKTFLQYVPESDKETPLCVNDGEIIKTLGIKWEPSTDIFRYILPKVGVAKKITKRVVLAELSTLFDPLGLVNPVIVAAKVFMQDLWLLKVDWDESLPMNLHSYWMQYREKLRLVEDIKVPRYVLSINKHMRVEMHGFADASVRAYGCCIYVRCTDYENKNTIQLWSAKSRVAPIKTKSLPRLELLAAELLSNLVAKTQENFPVPVDATFLWTDSEIVLDWLRVHPSTWSIFVANRVALIQESTKEALWRHVPSKMNPADIVSRGAFADELRESIWFSGPDFLRKDCENWPANKTRKKTAEVFEERRQAVVTLHVDLEKNAFLKWIEDHSEYEKIRKKVALLLCVLRPKERPNGITVHLLDEALMRIVYCLQQFYFSAEIRALKKNVDLPSASKLNGLNSFIDNNSGVDILRVGGRLRNAELPYDAKYPILLPNESNFVRCYVRFVHDNHLHAGTQALMAIMRQRFWILNARKLVRAVTSKCLKCFRCRPQLQQQIMGDLPADRVNMARPFATTGVDFCGPVQTTYKLKGVRFIKSYIAVFICFATKAVHLEVVSDLTSKAFIASLKRFVARRGLCARLWCDNATNFVGARRELMEFKEIFFSQHTQSKISMYCIQQNINFHHIPPRSPHFGGLWEAAVKSAKYHLTRILTNSYLTFEELSTVTAEIEAVLNSRPLTAMSNDPNDEAVLTPAHFLIGGPLVGISEPMVESDSLTNMNRWLRIAAIQQHFWKRWSTEYLHEMQKRIKWDKKVRNIEEGDLVLVAEENLPPKQWLLGRVLNVVKGTAGHVRVVNVKTKNGVIRRAVQRVALIPNASEVVDV